MKTSKLYQRQAAAGPPAAAVEWGAAYEALLSLSMFTGDEAQRSYDVGTSWFRQTRRLASAQLVSAIKQLVGTAGPRWFLLLGMVHDAGGARDVAALLAHMDQMQSEDLLTALLGGRLPALRVGEGAALVAAAVAGDVKVASAVAARSHQDEAPVVRRLTTIGPTVAKRLAIEIVDRWHREVGRHLDDQAATLAADAADKAAMARRMPPKQLIDTVTGGITYEGEAGIDRVLLVPTMVARPWVTISEWDSTKVICYSYRSPSGAAADPTPDLALVYRALGDETRLRLLRELAIGGRRVFELANSLGLAKSTIHGHLAVLRAAGLIQVNLGDEKRYGLRVDIPDLGRLLADYLDHRRVNLE